jgi:ribosome-binding factor A
LSELLSREVQDPGIGFLTITRVEVTADLQNARAYYTTLGDAQARKQTARALGRATPFLRRQLGIRLRLRRIPELQFFYDESIERLDRVERILQELESERATRAATASDDPNTAAGHGETVDTEPVDTNKNDENDDR